MQQCQGTVRVVRFSQESERLVCKLCGITARRASIPNFGVIAARAVPVWQAEGWLTTLLSHEVSVFSALQRFCTLSRRVSSGPEYLLVRGESTAYFCQYGRPGVEGQEQAEAYVLLLMLEVVQSLLGRDWVPPEIRIIPANIRVVAALPEFRGTRIYPSSDRVAIAVPLTDLALRPLRGTPSTFNESGWGELARELPDSIRASLRPYLAEGRPNVNLAAEIAGMSLRTLQRRLADSGLSYRDLVDQACLEIARDRLDAGESSITDIAFDLGFSNVPGFTRAFKRWTGVSPREYRNRAIKSLKAA